MYMLEKYQHKKAIGELKRIVGGTLVLIYRGWFLMIATVFFLLSIYFLFDF